MKKAIIFSLFSIFLLAYFLRVIFLPKLSLTFGYDQARDALVTQQILGGDLKILGPPASTPGLYHGVFYYYLLAPAYLLGKGSPIIAAYWIALVNTLVVFIVYYLGYIFTRKHWAGIAAAFIYAISFEAVQYATWLSNPTIGIITVPLMYLGLWLWLFEKKKVGPVLTGLGLGLSIQAEVFLLYHLAPLGIWLWVLRKNVNRHDLLKFGLMVFLSISSMIIAEIKFGFRSISGVLSLLTTQEAIVSSKSLGDFLVLFFNQVGRVFAFSSYPGNIGYGSMFVLVLIILALVSSKGKIVSWPYFLATWLFSHITVVSLGGTSTPFLLVGIAPAVSLIVGISLYKWFARGSKAFALLFLALVVFGNLAMIFKENPKGSTIFAIQKDMLLQKQFAVIDYTYEKTKGEIFSINSLTSPLWINIVWSYLYKWYGAPKYGYLPQWHGRDQVGQLDALPSASASTKKYFLILEPMGGIPQRYLTETVAQEDSYSKFIGEKSFGELIVQERLKIE